MSRLGVVAALEAEARALKSARTGVAGSFTLLNDGSLLAVSGMGLASAATAADALIEAGCTALVSFGLAGGLAAELCAGALLLPRAVLGADGRRHTTDEAWRARLLPRLQTLGPVAQGDLYTSATPLAHVVDKARVHAATGAMAVDMEAAAVAGVAARRGLPFLALRVVIDTCSDELPRAVAAASEGGRLRIGRLLAGLARRPGDLGSLLRLAGRYRVAMRMLTRVGREVTLAPSKAS